MRILIFTICLIIILKFQLFSQDNVGIGTTTPNSSSILELSATDKGFLVPRLTTAQRNAIGTPATGLIIFNTESGTFEYYSGASWIHLFSGSFLSLTNGRIFVGNATNQAVAVNLSGDATITNTGVLTIGDDKITTSKILDGNITTSKIADNTITNAKILDGNVTTTKIVDNAITNSKVSSTAEIEVSKLANSNTDLQIIRTNGSSVEWWTPNYLTSYTESDPLWSASPSFGITNTNISNWNTAYGWGNHATAGYLTSYTESDPLWSASPSFGITNTNISNWNTAYGWGNHATAGYLTSYTESDPLWSASPSFGITNTNISNWNTAYGWGNHATAGYLTSYTESDPLWSASPSFGITNTNISNWNTAYGWGNHATAGYLTSYTESDPLWSASPSFGITNTNISNWNTAYGWGNHATAGYLTSYTETDPVYTAAISSIIYNTTLAGGDLNGSYPNPTVDALQGFAVSNSTPTDGQVLTWNNTLTRWEPQTPSASSGWSLTGNDLTGTEKIGSTNAQPLLIITNNLERMRVWDDGQIGINYSTTFEDSIKVWLDGDMMIDGDLIVTGTIDPLALQLIPQSSAPNGLINKEGFMYYDDNANTIKISDGTSWSELGSNLTNGLNLKNSDNIAKELKFYEPYTSGSNYTAFKAQAQDANITYTLPIDDGTDGQVLTTDGGGGLTWESPSSPVMTDTTIATTPVTLNGNHSIYIIANPGSANVKLPLSSNFKGKTITIKAKPQGSYTYNVGPQTGDQLDYATANRQIFTIPSAGNFLRGITVYSDGSQWHTISTINY